MDIFSDYERSLMRKKDKADTLRTAKEEGIEEGIKKVKEDDKKRFMKKLTDQLAKTSLSQSEIDSVLKNLGNSIDKM